MQSTLLTYIRGYVEVEITAKRAEQVEAFINIATVDQLTIWHIRRTGPDSTRFLIDLQSFFKLRPILRQTGCRIRVGQRHGMPFLLRRAESRLFFAAGFVFFILGIYLLSQLIWKIDIEGNDRISYDQIVASAEKLGIRPFQWKFRLDEPQRLSRLMTHSLEGAAWVGVEVRGTRVLIQVVEQTKPEERKLMSPRHLVSGYDAVITQIFSRQGKPTVRVHSKVKKGDILISGWIGSETSGTAVVAEGSVRGVVWHQYTISSPLKYKHKVYTGAVLTRRYAVFGNRALQLTGYGKPEFAAFESDVLRKTLAWRQWKIPLGYIKENLKEMRIEEETVSAQAAKEIGLTHAKAEILRKTGSDANITDEKILHEKIEGGKVYMKVLFEVEQEIAKEIPIVQGD